MSSPHDNSIYTNENSVFFALTRMNPPMPGHLGIVEILINKAIEKGINQVYVCLSKVLDKGNPISCELKKSVLGDEKQAFDRITMINSLKRKMIEKISGAERLIVQKKIQDMHIILICVSDYEPSPFHTIQKIILNKINSLNQQTTPESQEKEEDRIDNKKQKRRIALDKINLFMVAGEDRVDFIDSVDKYYSKWAEVHTPILRMTLPRGGMVTFIEKTKTQEGIHTLDIDLIDSNGGWSGTMIRNIVSQGGETKRNKLIFQKIYNGMLETNVADILYDAIWDGLKNNKSPSKKTARKTAKSTQASYGKNVGESSSKRKKTKMGGKQRFINTKNRLRSKSK